MSPFAPLVTPARETVARSRNPGPAAKNFHLKTLRRAGWPAAAAVIVDPIGVTSSTLNQDCLRKALAVWNGSVQITPMPVWLGITLGTIMGGVFGLLIGLLVLPLRAAYLALFALGFSKILRAAISAEIAITRGQGGIELP
jgi:ABC-type branched-subunit amino acid transport system permease subunit